MQGPLDVRTLRDSPLPEHRGAPSAGMAEDQVSKSAFPVPQKLAVNLKIELFKCNYHNYRKLTWYQLFEIPCTTELRLGARR